MRFCRFSATSRSSSRRDVCIRRKARMSSSAGSPAKRSVVDDCCAVLSVATPVRPPKSSVLTLRPGGALKPAGSYAANGTPGMAADRLACGDAAYVPLRSSATCPRIPQKGALFGNDIGRIVELAAEEGSDGSELEKPGTGTIELHNVAQVVIHAPHVTQEIGRAHV